MDRLDPFPDPCSLLRQEVTALRELGFSRQKVTALRTLAEEANGPTTGVVGTSPALASGTIRIPLCLVDAGMVRDLIAHRIAQDVSLMTARNS